MGQNLAIPGDARCICWLLFIIFSRDDNVWGLEIRINDTRNIFNALIEVAACVNFVKQFAFSLSLFFLCPAVNSLGYCQNLKMNLKPYLLPPYLKRKAESIFG